MPSADTPSRPPALLCVTLSPAIDRTARVPRLELGRVLRPDAVAVLPGGKGINAARAAKALGGIVTTTGFAGGHAGRWLVEALQAEGLGPRFVEVAPETRTTYVTVDPTGRSTLVYEPAAPLAPDDLERLLRLLTEELLAPSGRVIISGSQPPGLPEDAYRRLVQACRGSGHACLVDVGGAALSSSLIAGPAVVKVSLDEANEAGFAGDPTTAARALVRAGAGLAVVTDGPRGASAATAEATWEIRVPAITLVNPVGSGDAFDAGLSVALEEGATIETALAAGAAAGTANVESMTAGAFMAERARALQADVEVRRID